MVNMISFIGLLTQMSNCLISHPHSRVFQGLIAGFLMEGVATYGPSEIFST